MEPLNQTGQESDKNSNTSQAEVKFIDVLKRWCMRWTAVAFGSYAANKLKGLREGIYCNYPAVAERRGDRPGIESEPFTDSQGNRDMAAIHTEFTRARHRVKKELVSET